MANSMRCSSTNTDVGEYYELFMGLRNYLNINPPKAGEKTLVEYLAELGIIKYPEIGTTIANVRFVDAHLINNHPHKS
jgi:hypothetical protein